MRMTRLIPRLDIKGPNLVKGIHMEGLRVLGSPERFARFYYEQGADELIYMDVVASLYGRNGILGLVEATARQTFIPLTVGGGIRSLDDIQATLRAGADKVAMNTAVIGDPGLIRRAAKRFGTSTIVVSIEAIRKGDKYEAFTDCGRERTGVDAIEWAQEAAELGAGEILVTAIDREGTGGGFDLELTRRISDSVHIPVIASGGAGAAEHVRAVIQSGHADAVAVASLVHYDALAVLGPPEGGGEGNVDFARSGRAFSIVRPTGLGELRRCLLRDGIGCRVRESVQSGADAS